MQDKLTYWRDVLHPYLSVLSVIKSGAHTMSKPTDFNGSYQELALENAEFIGECIVELVSGFVGDVETAPALCSSLSAVANSTGNAVVNV